jgi:ribosomal-protein-alanine N-acetyltransferase
VAVGFLEINGEWEDHVRYAMTSEEWSVRRVELASAWID